MVNLLIATVGRNTWLDATGTKNNHSKSGPNGPSWSAGLVCWSIVLNTSINDRLVVGSGRQNWFNDRVETKHGGYGGKSEQKHTKQVKGREEDNGLVLVEVRVGKESSDKWSNVEEGIKVLLVHVHVGLYLAITFVPKTQLVAPYVYWLSLCCYCICYQWLD